MRFEVPVMVPIVIVMVPVCINLVYNGSEDMPLLKKTWDVVPL